MIMKNNICYHCKELIEGRVAYTQSLRDEDNIELGIYQFCGRDCIQDYYEMNGGKDYYIKGVRKVFAQGPV